MYYIYAYKHVYECMCVYCKLKKLRGRKVLRFIGFYYNVGKTFAVLLLISMKTTF